MPPPAVQQIPDPHFELTLLDSSHARKSQIVVRRSLMSLRRSVVRFALVVALAVAVGIPAFSQERTVTKVAIVAKPQVYTGPCPAALQFIATVFVSHHPVWIDYRWERSDGAMGPRTRLEIGSAGQGIYTTWTLSKGGTFWERLHVLAPTGISSPQGTAHVNCR
jgi:hypothetical protein